VASGDTLIGNVIKEGLSATIRGSALEKVVGLELEKP
jgi:hypothetical protein